MKQIVTEYAIRELAADLATATRDIWEESARRYADPFETQPLKEAFALRIADWLSGQDVEHDELDEREASESDDTPF